jgi:hypothetical protein
VASPTGCLEVRQPVVITGLDVVNISSPAFAAGLFDLTGVVISLQYGQPDGWPVRRKSFSAAGAAPLITSQLGPP